MEQINTFYNKEKKNNKSDSEGKFGRLVQSLSSNSYKNIIVIFTIFL